MTHTIRNYFIIILLSTHALCGKFILWDVGDTLLKPSKFAFAWATGLDRFIDHLVLDRKNPTTFSNHLQIKLFSILDHFGTQTPTDGLSACTIVAGKDRPLPQIMCDWFVGTITGRDAYLKACSYINRELKCTTSERRLYRRMIHSMFDASTLAHAMYPIDDAVTLLHECAHKGHTMIIVSNFDQQSFNILYHLPQTQAVFKYFKPENIVISGAIGLMKPDLAFFAHVLEKYHINPADCVFIDDRAENVAAAMRCGIPSIQVKNYQFGPVRSELKRLGLL